MISLANKRILTEEPSHPWGGRWCVAWDSAEVKLLWALAAVSLVVKGSCLFSFAYGLDDYAAALSSNAYGDSWSTGRFLGYYLLKAGSKLGLLWPLSYGLYGAFYIGVTLACSLALLKLWGLHAKQPTAWVVAGLFCFHPFQAEFLTYKMCYLVNGASLGLVFAGLMVCGRELRPFVFSLVCFTASLCVYQLSLEYGIAAALLGLALAYLRNPQTDHKPAIKRAIKETPFLPQLAAMLVSCLCYAAITRTITILGKVEVQSRFAFVRCDWHDIHVRLWQIKQWLLELMSADPLHPRLLKLGYATLIFCCSLTVLEVAKRTRAPWRGTLLATFIILASAFGCICIQAVGHDWYTGPRLLGAVSVWWAGVYVISDLTSSPWLRRLLLGVGLMLALGSAGMTNAVLNQQQRVNLRDHLLANRIVARLENHPDFAKARRLVVVGEKGDYIERMQIRSVLVGASAFGIPWSKQAILREVSGYYFGDPTPQDLAVGEQYAKRSKPWPSPKSIHIEGDLAIVVLPGE